MRYYPKSLPFGLEYINSTIIRKVASFSLDRNRDLLHAICKHLITNQNPMVVPIYDFQYGTYRNGLYNYSYDMMALLSLYSEERRLINLSADLYDKYHESPSQSNNEHIRQGWLMYPQLMSFLEKSINMSYHQDIHDGNIMIDENDNYLLIDLEGFIHSRTEYQINNWNF